MYIPKVKAVHVSTMSRQSDESCHRSFFFLIQWQLSYEETVKHVLAVWNMPRITTLYERRIVH